MEGLRKRSLVTFGIWVFASVDLYVLSVFNHLSGARVAAFVAVFLSAATFALAYRSNSTSRRVKAQAVISASATLLAGIVYLVQTGWRP